MIDASQPGTQLLVSVRSAAEAEAALAGGAALIDVKEPARGSLGRADTTVIREVAAFVKGRRPISAALGEWIEGVREIPDRGLAYVKWGLAGCEHDRTWQHEMARLLETQRHPQPVLVAYADWQCAGAPSVDEVFALARDHPGSVMLIDTYCKDAGPGKPRPTLLDWLPAPWVEDLCGRAREAGVRIALAGSLGVDGIRALQYAQPTWFAVRGAACQGGDRQGEISVDLVRQLVAMLGGAQVDDVHAQVG